MRFKSYVVLFLLPIYVCFGQRDFKESNDLKFKHFSLTEGLSQSSVLCILQDSKGFFWFGTRDGLNRFDGYEFTIYRHNQKNKHSLSNSYIKSLYEDQSGVLWIGTMNGLNMYNPKIDGFERFKFTEKKTFQNNKSSNEIWSIASNEKGYLWLGTNYGLEKFNTTNYTTTLFLANNENKNSVSGNRIRSLLIDKDKNLWICNTNSIDYCDKKTNKFQSFPYPKTKNTEINLNYIPVLFQDNKENLWLGLREGLMIFNKKSKVFESFKINALGVNQIQEEVRSIHQDREGFIWVGTYKGLFIIDIYKDKILHFIHDENNQYSLSQNSVYQIYEDSKGDMWIGTYAGGVNYYDRRYDLFKHFTTGTNKSKLSYKVVSSIIEDPMRNLWIGTEGGGINFYNRKQGKFEYYQSEKDNPHSLSANNVKSMIRTRNGDFWIGTHDEGLNFLNPNLKPLRFEKFKKIIGDSTSLSNNRIISLFEDYRNNIWIGTSGGGLNIMKTDTKTINRIEDHSGILSNIIYNISKSSSKDTILVSGDKGLVKFNINTLKFVQIDYKKPENAYEFNATLCVYEDPSRNLWIATEGDGLYHYDITTNESSKFGIPEGLPNEVIYGILPENNNILWLSTNHGLSRFNINSKSFKNFDISDGLLGDEFNFGAFLKLRNGNLMFGGTNGIDYFNPKDIVKDSFVPPVSITGIYVNNKPFLVDNNKENELTLKHNQNVFSFNFVALSYSQPNKNQYVYKLEGFDSDWNFIENKKSATYTNLDAGKYVFKVKASNGDGLWNQNGASMNVNILPAPWRTNWAYFLYSLLLLGILLIIRKYSLIRIYEKNQLKQERIEKERIEEINQMKLRLFTNISHDFRTPLTLIIGPLERMLSQNIGNDFVKKQHEVMHRNAVVLLQLINQLLDFRKSETGKLKLNASKNDIISFVKEIKLSFEELARVRQIKFTFSESEKPLEVWFDVINLKKVLFNLLSNAFKFTSDGGIISIQVSTVVKKINLVNDTQYCKIVISDNGRGIPQSKNKAIFDRYYQFGEDENTRSGTGIGLALCKNIVKLHHGKIKVRSMEGKGSSFIVLLPLGRQHLNENEIINVDLELKNNAIFHTNDLDFFINEEISNDKKVFNFNLDNSKPSILLVEDNNEVRKFLKEIFVDGYNIFEAENGKMALEIAKNYEMDLIISDVMMPIMDGPTFCNEVKTNILTSHIPIILLTAKTSEDSQKQGYLLGADAYITKPFDIEVLKVRVENLIGLRKNLINKFRKDIILEPSELTITSADELFLQKAIDIVEENISNSSFSVNDFIDQMGMSRSVIYRKLKALTDQSLTEFIRTIKLKRAGQLILQSQLSISEIAFDLGFNDLKHFRKSFQKLFNELPSEYRQKKNLGGNNSNS